MVALKFLMWWRYFQGKGLSYACKGAEKDAYTLGYYHMDHWILLRVFILCEDFILIGEIKQKVH